MEKAKKFKMTKKEMVVKKGKDYTVLYQIRALIDIPPHGVKAGDYGGYIQSEEMLSHEGSAWVKGGARLSGKESVIEGDVLIEQSARVHNSQLDGTVIVTDYAEVTDTYLRGENVLLNGKAQMVGSEIRATNMHMTGNAKLVNVFADREMTNFQMTDNAKIENKDEMNIGGENISISGNVQMKDARLLIGDNIYLSGNVIVDKGSRIQGSNIIIQDSAVVRGVNLYGDITVQECVTLFCSANYHLAGIRDATFQGDLKIDVETL